MQMFSKAIVLAAFGFFPLAAGAAPLTVVDVGAPAINCVFNVTCTVVVNDSVGNFTPPGDSAGSRLQSRTYPGTAPAPAAGALAYVYRVDMTAAQAVTAPNCVTKLTIDFGPVVKMPYSPNGLADVFVVTSGGLGSVVVASADQTGSNITFTFAAGGVCPGATSYFFGLTSKSTVPQPGVANLTYSLGGGGATVDRRP